MRLIDADALIAFMRKGWRVFPSSKLQHTCDITDIENAPTIDAVEVVRCKDCIYYGDHGDGEMACAMMILYPNKPTDYCSLGERREDETN